MTFTFPVPRKRIWGPLFLNRFFLCYVAHLDYCILAESDSEAYRFNQHKLIFWKNYYLCIYLIIIFFIIFIIKIYSGIRNHHCKTTNWNGACISWVFYDEIYNGRFLGTELPTQFPCWELIVGPRSIFPNILSKYSSPPRIGMKKKSDELELHSWRPCWAFHCTGIRRHISMVLRSLAWDHQSVPIFSGDIIGLRMVIRLFSCKCWKVLLGLAINFFR